MKEQSRRSLTGGPVFSEAGTAFFRRKLWLLQEPGTALLQISGTALLQEPGTSPLQGSGMALRQVSGTSPLQELGTALRQVSGTALLQGSEMALLRRAGLVLAGRKRNEALSCAALF